MNLTLRGLNKLGDVWCPGDKSVGSFSSLSCASRLDEALETMPPSDASGLRVVLGIFALLPKFAIALVIRLLESSQDWPRGLDFIGSTLRLLRLGLKGIVMALYYSDQSVTAALGYRIRKF